MTKYGESLELHGYDIIASAPTDDGQVLILNNNSTHFLVVANQCDQGDIAWPNDAPVASYEVRHTVVRNHAAVLLASFPYLEPGLCRSAYTRALNFLVHYSLTHIDTMDEDM